ncbi:hypothetical protein EPA93_47475 [Ktedonosporobacter rubrisoli]|uniref:Uncharacterized protein n=1 Tax=Ktedonosporobacter rubrisoli TaxID=2509675 RepID=A0A4V0Z0H1_KTERU|nr:hypothetical protein [Ktedonosporobacter rubrisoli]QBD83201.1 hypothetical protein EPA93_47475 [Ktedonosporobacter rubrisoli]
MEPVDTDFDYVARQSQARDTKSRFNWLYLFPALGVVWLLLLLAAATFQFSITDVVNPVMTIMVVLFFLMVGFLFWAMAPQGKR